MKVSVPFLLAGLSATFWGCGSSLDSRPTSSPAAASPATPVAAPAEAEIGGTAAALQALLPSGWSIRAVGQTIIVQRSAPVRFVNSINADVGREGESEEEWQVRHSIATSCQLELRLGPLVSTTEHARLAGENRRLAQQLEELEGRMRGIDHKFDSYAPTTEEERALVRQHDDLKQRRHVLPTLTDGRHSVYVTSLPHEQPGKFVIEKDCRAIKDRVLSRFRPQP